MIRRRCSLEWPTEADYALIAEWLRPGTVTGVLTGDSEEVPTAADLRALNESGQVRYFMAVTEDGSRVGVVNYRRKGLAGSYSLAAAVGDPERWNSGFGAEALVLLVDHLFHQLNAHRVEFTTASFNRTTMSVLTKGGFVLEGVLRDTCFVDGTYHDTTIWSLLREEFCAGAAAFALTCPVPDLVPAEDKRRAKQMLADYLTAGPPTSLTAFAERAVRPRPY